MPSTAGVESRLHHWERTESRVVRPFKSAEDYLADVAIRLYVDDEFTTEETLRVESVDRDRFGLALRLSRPPERFGELVGVGVNELRLIISIEDRTLKQFVVLRSVPLEKVDNAVFELADESRDAASWSGDTRVHVAVVLSNQREAVAGLAHRVGSWVARKTFIIAPARDTASFSVQPVDEEWFVTRGLPASTSYFVEILDTDLNQPCNELPQIVKVYINKNLNDSLSHGEESLATKALVKAVYVDVVSSVLTVGFSNLDGEIQPNSILSVVSRRLSKATRVAEEKLAEFARENNGTRLRAIVQAEARLTKSMIAAASRRGV